MDKAKAVQQILRNYEDHIEIRDGEPHASKELQSAIAYAILFIEAMQGAIDQIREEVTQATDDESYVDDVLSYRSHYGDDAFSGISRAEDIIDTAIEHMDMHEVMERIMRHG